MKKKMNGLSGFALRNMSEKQKMFRQMAVAYLSHDDLDTASEIAKDLERRGQRSALGDEILSRQYFIESTETEDQRYALA